MSNAENESQLQAQYNLTNKQKSSVAILSIGTFLEYFDLMLYVHMAVLLNELFFPKTDIETASLLSGFTFCLTFIFRPVGAIIFGYLGDNIGRKYTVIITTFLMALSCFVMTQVQTYAQIGIAASWIVSICRIVQGMCSMGEIMGAEIYISETIKPPSRYSAASFIILISKIGGSVALGVASFVLFYGAGWRSAFGAGCIIAIIGIIARIALKETPEFLDAKRRYKKILEKIIDDKKNRNNIYLIKLFDRLHNMQTISFQSIEKQKKIASETLIYILPIAIYLEISKVEKLLADICERVLLNPSVQNSHTESEYIKKNPEDYINRLIEKLEELNYYDKGKIDISLVSRAIDCARTYHGGQKRLSGEPYYVHPVEVAYLIICYANHQSYISTDIIVSAILHDIVEDTDFTIEMIKLSFGIGVSKIVYGLTRVRKEKKLTVPELLDSIFNDQSSLIYTHKNKSDVSSFIYYTFIGAVWPLWFYINYVHSGSVLKSKFGFSSEEIIANSMIISFIEILACMVCVYLSGKIHPLKITKVKTYLFLPVAFLYPFLLSNCSSGNDLFWLQALCVIFVPGTFPADSAMIPHFYVFKRFTYSCMSYAISRALVYLISSFGFVLLIKYCGNIGMLCIIIPIMISSIFGINYFISLEKKTGYYDL